MAVPQTTAERGIQDTYNLQQEELKGGYINVGEIERVLSVLGGGVLTLSGLQRFSLKGIALAILGGGLVYRGVTGHSNLYQKLEIMTSEKTPTISKLPGNQGIKIQRSMTINRAPEALYNFWHDVEKAPLYMKHIASVKTTGNNRSHWVAKLPMDTIVEWDSEMTQDEPNTLIAWQTIGKSPIASAGSVRFESAPTGRGTVVTLELEYYQQLGGELGVAVGRLFGRFPEHEALENLHHFKALMEAGEVSTIEGQTSGRSKK